MSISQQSLHAPDEEDLGWREPWYHSDDELDPHGTTTSRSQHTKGKAKATGYRPRPSSHASENGDTDGVSHLPSQRRNAEAYPPTTDEGAETRRVVENLRRWEVAERQRWKAARDSSFSRPSSVLASATHRATSFWSRRASHTPEDSGGRHRVLQTSEDDGHLEDLAPVSSSSALSPPFAPPPEQHQAGPYAHPSDPFSDPPGSTSSLFVNALPVTSDIGVSASVIAFEAPTSATDSSSSQSTKVSRSVSAPAPLDLPEPRSPPPRTATPHANRPPEPFPRPDSRMSYAAAHGGEDEKPVRWWTEWLCGCSEGTDRGGEIQAGRTNPLE